VTWHLLLEAGGKGRATLVQVVAAATADIADCLSCKCRKAGVAFKILPNPKC
jgi:hypothetical protein